MSHISCSISFQLWLWCPPWMKIWTQTVQLTSRVLALGYLCQESCGHTTDVRWPITRTLRWFTMTSYSEVNWRSCSQHCHCVMFKGIISESTLASSVMALHHQNTPPSLLYHVCVHYDIVCVCVCVCLCVYVCVYMCIHVNTSWRARGYSNIVERLIFPSVQLLLSSIPGHTHITYWFTDRVTTTRVISGATHFQRLSGPETLPIILSPLSGGLRSTPSRSAWMASLSQGQYWRYTLRWRISKERLIAPDATTWSLSKLSSVCSPLTLLSLPKSSLPPFVTTRWWSSPPFSRRHLWHVWLSVHHAPLWSGETVI